MTGECGRLIGICEKFGTAEAGQLGVEVAEQPSLHQRIVDHFDATHEVTNVVGDLLHLGEEVGRVAVERHAADRLHGHELFGHELGRVEQVDAVEVLVLAVRHHLHAELPLRERGRADGVVEVTAVEVGVDTVEGQGLVPHQAVHAEHRLPVELHQAGAAVGVDETEGVDAEALHHAIGARDRPVGHRPHQHVGRLGDHRDEVPERRVRGLRLRDLTIGFRLGGVDQIRELDAVPDEEHGDVVADEIEDALVGVELHREAADVAHGVGGASRTDDGGEPCEHRRHPPRLEESRARDLGDVAVRLEHAVRSCSTGVHHTLRDPLVIEVHDLLAEVEVLQQRRSPHAGRQRVVGVGQALALCRSQEVAVLSGDLAPPRVQYRRLGRAGDEAALGPLLILLRRPRVDSRSLARGHCSLLRCLVGARYPAANAAKRGSSDSRS